MQQSSFGEVWYETDIGIWGHTYTMNHRPGRHLPSSQSDPAFVQIQILNLKENPPKDYTPWN